MTRKELLTASWKAFDLIEYCAPRMDKPVECLLLSVQFDDEIMVLQPLSESYKKDDFYANTQYCFKQKKKMSAAALHGKKVREEDKERLLRHGDEDFLCEDDPDEAS
jgi:hypothetical protein